MAEVTPIGPICPPKKQPASSVSVEAMDTALNDQRGRLFQAMGIVRLASTAIREPADEGAATDAWTALDAAYAILRGVADRLQDSETMLAAEVRRSEY